MGSSKKVTVGYRYLFGIHMGLNRGAVDEIIEIQVGDRTAWSGSITSNQTVDIDAPELFGGDKGEGGIQGTLEVLMGEPDQAVSPALAAMLGGIVPAFRGVCTLFYDGLVTSLNPYPKSWKVRRRRALKGWDGPTWYPEKAIISLSGDTIKAMNGAQIIYEACTNRDWGRGLSATRLDAAAFTVAADTLFSEGFGLCLTFARRDSVDKFIQHVLDHIGANLYVDRFTGLLTLSLVRDDYDPDLLPLFTPDSGLLAVEEDKNTASSGAISQQVVAWHDPMSNEPREVKVQNLALIQASGNVVAASSDYKGLPTAELALRVAQRDLRAGSVGLKRLKVRLDRRGYKVLPGGVFRISDPARGIDNMVLRAGRVDDGTLTSGAITITAMQDVFGLPATSYVDVQPPGWVPPNTVPTAMANRKVVEASYLDLATVLGAADQAALAADAGFVLAWGEKPTGLSLNYALQTRVGAVDFVEQDRGDFSPTAVLVAAMAKAAANLAINMSSATDLDEIVVGDTALIDAELFRVEAIDATLNTATLARGCGDTVPVEHLAGARIWFYDSTVGADPTEYISTTTVDARLLTHTSSGDLDPVLAAIDSVTMAQRQFRPYPPGKLLLNTVAYPASITGQLVIAWAHRDRILQDDQSIDTNEASIGPEPGTTYTLRLYDENDVLRRTESGLTGVGYTWASEEADSGLSGRLNNNLRIELESVRDGLASTQMHDVSVVRIA